MTTLIREGRRRCDRRCYDGKGTRCRCVCYGQNHGKGLEKAVEETRKRFDIFATENGVELFLKTTEGGKAMFRSQFEIVENIGEEPLVIRDVGRDAKSVTNDAENVVADLRRSGRLPDGRRLLYYDSSGQLDEIKVMDGKFAGFAPGPRGETAG